MSDFFAPLPPGSQPEKIPFLVTSSGANASPGPGGLDTRPGVLDNIPKTYLKGRTSDHIEVNQAPYRDIGSTIGKGKKFTLKGRTEVHIESGVSPEYVPPPFGADARKVSVHNRAQEKSIEVTPGPGQYKDYYRLGKDARKSTMHGPSDRSQAVRNDSPGPGCYMPKMPPNKPSTPNIRIGHRFDSTKVNDTPGPGQYPIKSTVGGDKKYGKIRNRWSDNHVNLDPGPADYDTQRPTLENITKISLHGRTFPHKEVNQAAYQDVRRSVSESPKYSMRSRYYTHSETTPGVDYVPPPFGKDSRRISISPRYQKKESETTPGPGQYKPKSARDFGNTRKSTFHGPRSRSVDPHSDSPGPAEYLPDYSPVKGRAPRFTMKGAKYHLKPEKSGEYVNLGTTLKGPRFSMKGRPTLSVAYG
ncbi:hypothetical protein TRFO_11959 [Tritrichomonas foetus]|uniref:Uncharacterized protein n=1 Tax=Tritrichomonas foetus TaxID=1144522 RepID=A0A1J4J333_9EUKA|nr:hypothetical protein TRFO_11959 [Tritrichomonas foetus]|eukprot:OHS93153.1 hypothetical protein TRFO_11959 [Tritrichomonas foetus]